jgi:cell division protein ZapA
MGQSYLLGCPDGGQQALLEAVVHVDREMCSIRDSGKVKARERIAVLAALNLAFGLAERPAAAAVTATAPLGGSSPQVAALVARIDEALGPDGQLL